MLDSLPAIITMIIALSVAAERVVEIIKSMVPWLETSHTDRTTEARRRAALQVIAIVAGCFVAYATWPIIAQVLAAPGEPVPAGRHLPTVLGVGLLASGGSGFWNSILTYVLSIKELRRADVAERRERRELPNPLEGELTA